VRLTARSEMTSGLPVDPPAIFPVRASRPSATAILNSLPDAVIATDGDGRVIYLNPAAERVSGWSQQDVLGVLVSRLLARERRREVAATGHVPGPSQPYQLLCRTGSPRPVEASLSVLSDERGCPTGRIYVCRDVGAALAHSQAMSHGALHDPLTGLDNRRRLLDQLQDALMAAARTGTSVGVCFVDIDGMKAVNDGLGHSAGDLLLRSVATRLLNSVRASDTVARIGGDEFVVVLHRMAQTDEARTLTQSVTRRLNRPHDVGVQTVQITASMGWAFSPEDSRDPHELLACADRAMYTAKRTKSDVSAGICESPR